MADEQLLNGLALALGAALARDLEKADLLSGTTRKLIHDTLGQLRGSGMDLESDDAEATALRRAAIHVLDAITPPADG